MLSSRPQKKSKTETLDRRRYQRHEIELNAYLKLSKYKEPRSVSIHNISEGGAFVETMEMFRPGDILDLSIELAPGLITVHTKAKIIYCSSQTYLKSESSISDVSQMETYVRRGHLTGCGVEFQNLSDKDRKFIHNFVEAIS
ncbi:MAG: PilZ domain-containing protein [Deltaproteobacteria bacterium]|nr:PilZ domain-containing protein [Deltaproteobacteria bacterium]